MIASKTFKIKYYYLFTPAVYLLISYLCLTSQPFPSSMKFNFWGIPNIDKLVHMSLYFILTTSTMFVLLKMKKLEKSILTLIWTITIPILFGGFVEIAQALWINGRSGDWRDFLANSIGVVSAYFLFRILSVRLSWK